MSKPLPKALPPLSSIDSLGEKLNKNLNSSQIKLANQQLSIDKFCLSSNMKHKSIAHQQGTP